MALVPHFDLELHQMDITTAFPNGDIEETIYMLLPENFISEDSKNVVYKLKKSIYAYTISSKHSVNGITSFIK